MSYGILPSFSTKPHNFGNMNKASSSSTFPKELAHIIEDDKVTFYTNNFQVEPESYNYYHQSGHRPIGVPPQCPFVIDYQSAGADNNHNPVLPKTLSPRTKVLDWRCQQSLQVKENPKKRTKDVVDQNVVTKKHANPERMQAIGFLRERVPVRRSQKLADKITALQKLVSPYGKTDTASVLQEAHITINLLHDQIQKLLQNTKTSMTSMGPFQFQNNEEAETSLRDRGLCLVPISSPESNNVWNGK